ncbi:MAG: hypothetical protein LH614_05840 [Pyrinomonadaceae bacterium]|nr:hypothetical protein [Pyrinomonadaceae bacterium]
MNDSEEKPVCPKCSSKSIAQIHYGLPAFTEDLERRLEAKEIILGGCGISEDSPKYQCVDCGEKFGLYL